jgi:hypothetical protein
VATCGVEELTEALAPGLLRTKDFLAKASTQFSANQINASILLLFSCYASVGINIL